MISQRPGSQRISTGLFFRINASVIDRVDDGSQLLSAGNQDVLPGDPLTIGAAPLACHSGKTVKQS
ncbi:MAG: hypothetical protein P8K79_04070 [Mariniblastus sp.]|nr:hypothetical protein [Mariniblastus sp.]